MVPPPPCPPIDIQTFDERKEREIFTKSQVVCTTIYLSQHRSKLEAATTSSRPCSPGGNAENQRAQCLADLPRALYLDPLLLLFFFFFYAKVTRFFLLVPEWSLPDPAVGHLQVYAFLVQQIKPLCPFRGPDWFKATFPISQFGDEWEKKCLIRK